MVHGRKAKEARSRKPRAGNLQSQTCALLMSVGLLIASCLGSWPYFEPLPLDLASGRCHLPCCSDQSSHCPCRQGAVELVAPEPDGAAALQFWDHHASADQD